MQNIYEVYEVKTYKIRNNKVYKNINFESFSETEALKIALALNEAFAEGAATSATSYHELIALRGTERRESTLYTGAFPLTPDSKDPIIRCIHLQTMPSKRTIPQTFRLPNIYAGLLNLYPYKNNKSTLLRILVEEYFAGRLPSVIEKFNSTLAQAKDKEKII